MSEFLFAFLLFYVFVWFCFNTHALSITVLVGEENQFCMGVQCITLLHYEKKQQHKTKEDVAAFFSFCQHGVFFVFLFADTSVSVCVM